MEAWFAKHPYPSRAAGLLCLMVLLAGTSHAGSNQLTLQGQTIRWKPNTPIPYVVNPGGVPGLTGELQRLVVLGAVNDAYRAWTEVSGASIAFSGGGTSQLTNSAIDGINLVSFQDRSFSFPPGVLAVALVVPATQTGTFLVGSTPVTVEFVGQIVDVDILFNPSSPGGVTFSPIGAANSVDLVSVGIHEVGHLLGLDHTGIHSSIMNPFSESGAGVASRTLQTDDAITVAALYPAASFESQRGAIAGTITTSTGQAVKSAHVVAVQNPGGKPVASQLSGADGKYRIAGLPPGSYQVMVEPLDGPIGLTSFGSFYANGSSNFASTFLGGLAAPTTVTAAAGQTAAANVVLPSTPAGLLNITQLGIGVQTTSGKAISFGPSPQFLPRGKSYEISVLANNITNDSNLVFAGTGITGGATTGATLSSGQTIRQQTITLSSSAALGPSNLFLSNAGSTSAFAGGIVATLNPSIEPPLREGAGFGGTVAPGGIISIFGTDLAAGSGAGGIQNAAATPLPTSMGGVSVKVTDKNGDRYAPLYFVSPGQINALLPFELSDSSAQVTIVTGPNAGGNTVTVNLSPTAPGMFFVDLNGVKQGAILNGVEQNQGISSLVAPVGSFPQARPAVGDEVIVIFASGLGPVSPALPSGVAAGAGGSTVPTLVNLPRVTIGGQSAPVLFAGLAPGFVGLYQLNVRVPANTPAGNAVPVLITTHEGQTSNTVMIAIGP